MEVVEGGRWEGVGGRDERSLVQNRLYVPLTHHLPC